MAMRLRSRWFLLLVVQLAVAMASGRSPLSAQEGGPARCGTDSVEVAVAARALTRGETLLAGDIAMRCVAADGRFARRQTPVAPGWLVRRIMRAGEVLRAPAVAPAPLVAAGQTVTFTVQEDGLALTLDGIAPVAGSLGDTIPVRLGARRRVTGVVAGPAHVVAIASSRNP